MVKLNNFLRFQRELPANMRGAGIKTYINSKIRKAEKFVNPESDANEYKRYFELTVFNRVILKLKSQNAIDNRNKELNKNLKKIISYTPMLIDAFTLYNLLVDAKAMILDKLNKGAKRFTNTFVKTDTGYEVVSDEGYVAIDTQSGNAVKLVDRLEFSYNNFNGIKNWTK